MRLCTTLVEIGKDKALLASYGLGAVLNGILLIQVHNMTLMMYTCYQSGHCRQKSCSHINTGSPDRRTAMHQVQGLFA